MWQSSGRKALRGISSRLSTSAVGTNMPGRLTSHARVLELGSSFKLMAPPRDFSSGPRPRPHRHGGRCHGVSFAFTFRALSHAHCGVGLLSLARNSLETRIGLFWLRGVLVNPWCTVSSVRFRKTAGRHPPARDEAPGLPSQVGTW